MTAHSTAEDTTKDILAYSSFHKDDGGVYNTLDSAHICYIFPTQFSRSASEMRSSISLLVANVLVAKAATVTFYVSELASFVAPYLLSLHYTTL